MCILIHFIIIFQNILISHFTLVLGLRYMTRALEQLNAQRQPGQPLHTYRLFDSFVRITFDAAIERRVFEQQPARRINRRHSVSQQPQPQQQIPQPEQSTRKRAASVDHRSYIAPEELRPVIDGLRDSIGKFFLIFNFVHISIFLKFGINSCNR